MVLTNKDDIIFFTPLEFNAMTTNSRTPFKRGDRIILDPVAALNRGNDAHVKDLGLEYGVTYEVEKDEVAGSVTIKQGTTRQMGLYASRFKLAPPAPARDPKSIFTREGAYEARQALVDAGIDTAYIRIRTRSWDRDALYFAVEVMLPDQDTEKLYRKADLDAYLASRKPIELTYSMTTTAGTGGRRLYQFRLPSVPNDEFLRAPDGSYWWTEAHIKQVGGVVTHNGRRYRLGERKFVPFVAS